MAAAISAPRLPRSVESIFLNGSRPANARAPVAALTAAAASAGAASRLCVSMASTDGCPAAAACDTPAPTVSRMRVRLSRSAKGAAASIAPVRSSTTIPTRIA